MRFRHEEHRRPKTPEEAFAEARRYYQNALRHLEGAARSERVYKDAKPVRQACGLGYLAALLAIDGALLARGIHRTELPAHIDTYEDALQRLVPRDGKLRDALTVAWENLHVFGYYRGGVSVKMIAEGLDCVRFLIQSLSGRTAA